MLIALVGLNANAAMYILGNNPFGDWNPQGGVEMFDSGNGVYTFKATIDGSVWFVFSDVLSDWDTVNDGTHRYGPTSGDQTVEAGNWIATQKTGDTGAYKFTGTGDEYTITFELENMQFKIEGYVEPISEDSYTVAGTPASLFGTEWDPANTDNDMVLVDGLYTWSKKNVELNAGSIKFKVAANHSWDIAYPSSDYNKEVPVKGIYDVTITIDPETKVVDCTLTLVYTEIRGDVDGDQVVNISDVTALIDYLLSGQTAPATADCDLDGNVNISDVTCLIDYLLSGNWPAVEMVYTVVGPQEVFGSDWNTNDENNNMVKGEDGVYTWNKENVTLTGNFKFKVVGNHDYSIYEWPIGGDWIANVAEEGIYTIVITFNPEAEPDYRITCTLTKTGEIPPVEHTYTVAGAPGSLFGSEWNAENEMNDMVKGDDGKYTWKYEGYVATGAVEVAFKVVQDHNWSNAWPASNYTSLIGSEGEPMTVYIVTITFDPETKEVGFGALPVQNPE